MVTMRAIGGRITLLLLVAALAACTGRPLDPIPPDARFTSPAPAPQLQSETRARLRLDSTTATLPRGWQVSSASPEQAELIHTAEGASASVSLLTFTEQGDTFLAAVDAAARADEPQARRYLTNAAGVPQGELLVYPQRLVAFLQPQASGGAQALRLEGANQDAVRQLVDEIELAGANAAPEPDVVVEFVEARETSAGVWSFSVTLRHPDTGWTDYADGWQVATPAGTILGTRILLHPHENEQPFTRSLGGLQIEPTVEAVQIVAHDLVSGYSIEPVVVPLVEAGEGDRYRVKR